MKSRKSAANLKNKEKPKERIFANTTKISKHLYCTICQEVFVNPKRLNCGHTFCDPCIDVWLKSNKTCPECRKSVNRKSMDKDLLALKMIYDLEISCPHKNCHWQDRLENYEFHLQNCLFRNIQTSNKKNNFENLFLHKSEEELEINEKLDKEANRSILERLMNKNSDMKNKIINHGNESNPQQQEEPQEDNSIAFFQNLISMNDTREESSLNDKENSNEVNEGNILKLENNLVMKRKVSDSEIPVSSNNELKRVKSTS